MAYIMCDTDEYTQTGTVEQTLIAAVKHWTLEHPGRRVVKATPVYACSGLIGIRFEHVLDTTYGR